MTDPRRGEIWWVDLEPVRGSEINKRRPALVVSGDSFGVLQVKLVAPLTTMKPSKVGKVWLVPIKATAGNGLKNDSLADVLQVRGVALERFDRIVGRVAEEDLSEVVAALAAVIEYE